jgi:glycosyltransferase involved in cell wall biosynthesis
MRIGIDGGCLSNRRGFGRFARRTVQALAEAGSPHQFVVVLDRPSAANVEVPEGFETVLADVREAPSRAASAAGRRRLGDLLAMGRAAARARLDLIYFPATYSFFPVWGVRRVVVTLHDTLALAHPDLVFPTRAGRLAWKLKEHAAVRWADRVVTVSEASRRDVAAWFRLDPGRIRVVTEGPDPVFGPTVADAASDRVLARYGIDPARRFLLYVGGLSPHKNLPRLIEAFAQAGGADDRLVLVGDFQDVFHTHVPQLRQTIARCGVEDRVHLTGFVPDADLARIYGRAYALAQPSLLEGFGLPPLEAMACGTPVLYSRAGSLPEVVGEAGIDFDPTKTASIAQAIRRLLDAPALRAALAARALERSRRFRWAETARGLLELFDELLNVGAGVKRRGGATRMAVERAGDQAPILGPASRMAGSARSNRRKFS